jgi:hypothetical protein
MPGLGPGIHILLFFKKVLLFFKKGVDGRDKPGHDDGGGVVRRLIAGKRARSMSAFSAI